MFSSGTMVEVSCKVNKVEVVWVPAMIVKEIGEDDKENEEDDEENEETNKEEDEENKEDNEETDKEEESDKENDEEETEKSEEDDEEIEEIENDERKFVVKFCDKSLSCKDDKGRPNKTVGLRSIRPTLPPFWVEEFQLREHVEVLHGTRRRQGQVIRFLSKKRNVVLIKATNQELVFKHSDLRPLKVWEDGIWKTNEVPLTQASGNTMSGSVMNGKTPSRTKEYGPLVTPSPGVTKQGKTPLKQVETETQGNTPKRNATRANENNENNNRKRRREENILPFEKKLLSIWKKVESREAFKTVTQSPHFKPLLETEENSRETFAIGMMFTYCALIEQVKVLQLSTPISALKGLMKSFAVLEKNGFDVKEPMSQINKLLSLKDTQAKKAEEAKSAEKELEERILELQRIKEKDREDAELQFQSIFSTPK